MEGKYSTRRRDEKCKVLVGKLEGQRLFGRPKYRSDENTEQDRKEKWM